MKKRKCDHKIKQKQYKYCSNNKSQHPPSPNPTTSIKTPTIVHPQQAQRYRASLTQSYKSKIQHTSKNKNQNSQSPVHRSVVLAAINSSRRTEAFLSYADSMGPNLDLDTTSSTAGTSFLTALALTLQTTHTTTSTHAETTTCTPGSMRSEGTPRPQTSE